MSDVVKTITLKIRVDQFEKRELEWAAKQTSQPLSVWLRALGLHTARALAEKAKKRVK